MGRLDDWAARWASRATGPTDDHVPQPRALTAAGAKVNLRNPSYAHTRREQWQTEAWNYREKIPEMRFAGDFVASTLGRLRIFPAENRPRGEEPVALEAATKRQQERGESGVDQETIDAALAATERLNLNQHGSSLLSRIAENLEYSGEAFLVGERDDDGQEQWSIRSVSELQITPGGARLVDPETNAQLRELRDDEADVMRLWNPHPRFYERPDAAVASLLDVLEGMFLLGRRGRSHDRSRISAGKGLFIPQEFMMLDGQGAAISADLPGGIDDPGVNPLMSRLVEYAVTPITDEGDPSAVVPLIFTGPAQIEGIPGKDAIGTFDLHAEDPRNLDERYEALVMRFARGINLSPERVKGLGDTNNWQANVITADEIKNAVEPRGERIVDALTAAYLQRMMRHMGISPQQRRKICLWFSASELTQNPNRGTDARALFDVGELSGEALRGANGFTSADAPSTIERLLRALTQGELANASVPALLKLANGQLPTVMDLTALEQAQARLDRPVVDVTPNRTPGPTPEPPEPTPPVGERKQPATQPGALGASAETKPQWRLERELGRKLARVDQDFTTRVLAATDASVGRAIEKAANRIRGDAQKDPARKAAFVPGADPRVILAAAGPTEGRRLAGKLADETLLADAFTELRDTFMAEADAAAAKVEAILEARLPGPITAAGGGRGVADAIRGNTGRAWSWLSDRLQRHATEVLYGGRQPVRGGEASPGLTPVSLVRGAAALLGGLGERHPGISDDGTSAMDAAGRGTASSGPGTGAVALERLRVSGGVIIGHEWNYNYHGQQVFSPHRRLDEVSFESWSDPRLDAAENRDWIVGGFYHPGDHTGCACTASPVAVIKMVEDADPRSGEIEALRAEAIGS